MLDKTSNWLVLSILFMILELDEFLLKKLLFKHSSISPLI